MADTAPTSARRKKNSQPESAGKGKAGPVRTLAVDVGGTGTKAIVLDESGKPISERVRLVTPKKATPRELIAIIRKLAEKQGEFDRVSVGFPGVVKGGVIYTAANLGKGWKGFDLEKALTRKLKRPARIANDADVQGLGCVSGEGMELVVTLGTGFGSVLFSGPVRIHLELAHHPFHRGKTYEEELGDRALHKKGRKKWNKLLAEAIDDLQSTFNFDRLFIGGGNSKAIDLKLPPQVQIVDNMAGLLGGIALWRELASESGNGASPASKKAAKPGSAKGSPTAPADGKNPGSPASAPNQRMSNA